VRSLKFLSAALICVYLAAQSIPPDEIRSRTVPYVLPQVILRTDVRVVEVPAVVRDAKGRAVAGLTRDDFKIDDDGKRQTITSFSVQSSARKDETAPTKARFLALVFDDLHLSPGALPPVKQAAERFVKNSPAPGDRAAVVTTSQSNKSVFTSDIPALVEQIAKVTSAPLAVFSDSMRCIQIAPHEAYMLVNGVDPGDQLLHQKVAECSACKKAPCHDGEIAGVAKFVWEHARSSTVNVLGLIESMVDGMSKFPGERIILLTSAGFLTDTLGGDVDRLTDKARHAEVVVNTLDAKGVRLDMAGMAYDSGMGALASGTGGSFYHNQNDLEGGFRELSLAPETIYVLGFTPSAAADGNFHKLKVQLAGKRYSIQARMGYTALKASASTPGSSASKLDSEVTASDTITDLPATFTWEQWDGPPGITMIAHLDIARLHFKPWQDRRTQKITIVAALLDSKGGFVAGKRSELELSFRDATFTQLAKTGFTAALTIKAPPGSYSVRAVAQDGMEEKLAAASGTVQIK
jgi:VWFA-related protein